MTEKWKTLGASLLPVFLWIFIQSMVLVSEPSLLDWELGALRLFGMEEEEAWVFLQENQTYVVYVLMNMITLIPASLWFRRLSMWTPRDSSSRWFAGKKILSVLHPGRLVFLLALGGFLQFFTDLILTGVAAGFPELMKSYSQVMDNLGMNSPTILSALYTLLLAPVTEELIFRGLTLGILERAFPFWQANLLQAACFGLIHGNPVQGIYAFGAGLIFGLLKKKENTLAAPVICHMAVNASGLALGFAEPGLREILLLSLVFLALTGIFWKKNRERDGKGKSGLKGLTEGK